MSEVKRVEFVSDRMLYIVLRGCWCNIIVLNVHTSSEEKIYNSKDGFDEELEQVFDRVPKYPMEIPLGDFNVKWVKRIFSNRQLGTRVYIRMIRMMIMIMIIRVIIVLE